MLERLADMVAQPPAPAAPGTGTQRNRMPRGLRIFIVFAFVVLGFVGGSVIREMTDFDVAGVGAAIGIPALVALFGMFWIAESWKDALTAATVVAYLIFLSGVLAIFVFPGTNLPLEGGAKVIVDNFTTLVLVVFSAYLGTEAVEAASNAFATSHKSEAEAAKIAALAAAGLNGDQIAAVLSATSNAGSAGGGGGAGGGDGPAPAGGGAPAGAPPAPAAPVAPQPPGPAAPAAPAARVPAPPLADQPARDNVQRAMEVFTRALGRS